MPAAPLTVRGLAEKLGLPVSMQGGEHRLTGVRTLQDAGPEHLSFLDNATYKTVARTTRAGAVLVRQQDADVLPATCIPIITANPYAGFALALQSFHPVLHPAPGSHESAVVSESAQVHPTARLEPGVVIYADAVIAAHVHVGAHSVIGRGVEVGEGTVIGAHCTLHKTSLGAACILHPGVRIGQDGFGFAQQGEHLIKVPQIGGVIIGSQVEIGANTTIDCGALGDTFIEDHVKIDNLVQIAHNVRIGRCSRIVAQTGIAGSTTLGSFNVIGGQTAIAGHLALADRVMVAARSGIAKSISTVGTVVGGAPAVPIQEWRRQVAAVALLARRKTPSRNTTEN